MIKNICVKGFLLVILMIGNIVIVHSESLLGKFSGKSYFEYFVPQNPDGGIEEFRFTRFYFTYDYKLSDDFSVRYRIDGDRKADGEKWRPFLKHAYISWANLVPGAKIYIGMQSTPNWSTISEKFWGYRSIEKTIQDKNKIGTSADIGFGVKGKLSKTIIYQILYGNGSGYGDPESDKYKKIYSLIGYKPNKFITTSIFYDYEPQSPEYSKTTLTLFGGLELTKFKIGVEYFTRTNKDSVDIQKTGLSVFGKIKFGVFNTFGRYDLFDPDTNGSGDEIHYVILGIDYEAHDKFHIMPNIRSIKKSNIEAVNTIIMNFEFKF